MHIGYAPRLVMSISFLLPFLLPNKAMMASMYDRFDDLVYTVEATHKTVTYEPNGSHYMPDEDLDFLDEND